MPATGSESDWEPFLKQRLAKVQADGLYRRHRLLDSPQGVQVVVDGWRMINFCSNDYLGLANDPRIRQAACSGVENWGVGSGSAHLVSGHSRAHQALEEALAEWTGRERALLFSSGYMANLAVLGGLLQVGDTVIQDKLDHASLIDGARLSGATLKRYPHRNMQVAKQRLEKAAGRCLLTVDGVFSMDGDCADLPELSRLCQQQGAWLMVDDAHGLGVLGRTGGGSLEHWGLSQQQVPVLMGTFGKAMGTAGAFVAGSELLIETLIQQARSYVFTTAMPPAWAEATLASLEILRREHWRREKLREMVTVFRQAVEQLGLELRPSGTPIQALIAGRAATALEWSRKLAEQGILVAAIRPPAVPSGQARLRITFSAAHQMADVQRLIEALKTL